jgi:hypothetical protein
MKHTQHTPGEWYSQVMGGDHDVDIYSGDTGKSIALVRGVDEESKANARLIEHAPELLKALKNWQKWAEVQRNIPNEGLPKVHDTAARLLYDIENPA